MTAMRMSLRAKLVRTMAGTLVVVSTATVVIFAGLNYLAFANTRKTVEGHLRAGIEHKGRGLVVTQALGLRDLVMDNAFGDVARLIERTLRDDEQLVYGLFLDEAHRAWGFSTRKGPLRDQDAWRGLAIPPEEFENTSAHEVRVSRRRVLGQNAFEFAMTVVDDKGAPLGKLFYALSDGPLRQALAEARSNSRRDLLMAISLFLLLGMGAAVTGVIRSRRSAVRITQPLTELTAAANTLASGNRDIRVQVTSGDELEILANAFNHMAAELQHSYARLQDMNRNLEIKVEERTTELRQRNADLRSVLDAINQGLVTIDRDGNLIGEWSARAGAWFADIAGGRSWIEVLASVDASCAREFGAFFSRLARGNEPLASLREQMPSKLALGKQTLEIDLCPLGTDETWKRILVVISDVTERERKARLELELRQGQKLQAVGELAAGIAHEINTPTQFVGDSIEFLAGVCHLTVDLVSKYRSAVLETGNASLVARMKQAEEAADMAYNEENAPAALARAREGISRIATIVRAMKEFAHPDHREKSAADLNRALETTLTIAHNEYKYVADAETAFGELPPVYCHVGDLNQVFLNLIVNAAHAISDVMEKSGKKGRIFVRTFSEGDKVRIEIGDTGCGIPPEIRDRVYDPFFTTKGVGKGSGQGLAIARNIVVDKHGGTLTFESEVGKGTTFVMVLPVGATSPGEEGTSSPLHRSA
jgi:signal transduction histidine kinase/HAMP domain-containing protein